MVEIPRPNEEGGLDVQKEPFNVCESIVNILLATGPATTQRLTKTQVLARDKIARKLLSCKESHILLEEEEFREIDDAFNAFSGFGRHEVELCKRIAETETVEVEEKTSK